MAVFLTLAIVMITIGACMLVRSDGYTNAASCSDRSMTESRVAIKKSNIRKLGGFENKETFCMNRNVFTVNKYGIALVVLGIIMIIIYLLL